MTDMTLILWNCIYIFKLYFFISYVNIDYEITSVIRQKGESQNGCFKKTNQFFSPIFPKNEHLCTYQRVRNVHFYKEFGVLCFLETPVLRFTLLPYYRRKQDLENQSNEIVFNGQDLVLSYSCRNHFKSFERYCQDFQN